VHSLLIVLCLALVAAISGCTKPVPPQLDGIVLVIADGTSQELISAARFYDRGGNGRLAIEDFPHTAVLRTTSASHLVTDSSSASTALARGVKADNRVVGMVSPNDAISTASILDIAKNAGWTTAVVTDDSVTGGTPSPFMVEHPNRDQHEFIAGKLLDRIGNRVDIVVGGGSKWFRHLPDASYKDEQKDIVRANEKKLGDLPIAAFTEWDAFREHAAGGGDGRPVLATFYSDAFPYYADGKRDLRLRDLVEVTVGLLRTKKKPFLLIVEAALPDKASHANSARRAIAEVLEFDATLDWLRRNLGPNTLILATTDHNTGGFAFNGYPPAHFKGDVLLRANPASGQTFITWASGPGGVIDGEPRANPEELTDPDYRQLAAIGAKSALHTGGDVWFVANGPGSEAVHGFLDNTDVFQIMRRAIEGAGSTQ
jgi:alkaline phosphatase